MTSCHGDHSRPTCDKPILSLRGCERWEGNNVYSTDRLVEALSYYPWWVEHTFFLCSRIVLLLCFDVSQGVRSIVAPTIRFSFTSYDTWTGQMLWRLSVQINFTPNVPYIISLPCIFSSVITINKAGRTQILNVTKYQRWSGTVPTRV